MTYTLVKRHEQSSMQKEKEGCSKRRSHDWCSFGAVAGLAGGIGSALLGSILAALSWLGGAGARLESVAGTVLLVLTIPLLILGAHCLDLTDKKKGRAREARVREDE